MIRSAILTVLTATLVAGCAGPIETRIMTQAAAPLPDKQTYDFGSVAEQDNELYRAARELVDSALKSRGFRTAENASTLVDLTLADRPADIAIRVGEATQELVLADVKAQKPLQSCKDREHRLTITFADRVSGAMLYSGTAAEYHCKGTIEESLPHLVRGAMAEFGSGSGTRQFVRTRSGVE
ncbi:protein of unknown function [Parasphingorhabdus marina DSM 22363]|uniref:DUF4136 domain-containing protein n=1 Tax=Parasphingorhabdus marina DSM 22363 TaxID=1123272 RepID=A0A1N6D5F2_9SPHN|nr:DUF4136 domain-containing protein [Parasphingorhabdus marina]SIN66021.1 protein of unknown function [Parasphingorhabdus marina DSM 22363]